MIIIQYITNLGRFWIFLDKFSAKSEILEHGKYLNLIFLTIKKRNRYALLVQKVLYILNFNIHFFFLNLILFIMKTIRIS